MPLISKYKEKEYICFIDYSKDNVYFVDNNIDEEVRKELTKLVLLKVNKDNLVDVKTYDINSNSKITKIINDIKNDTIIKKFSTPTEENNNE